MEWANSAAEAAGALAGRRYVDAEFMYKPRPESGRERVVFDYTLHSRLAQLEAQDAALFICDRAATADSLADFQAHYPHIRMVAALTNPTAWDDATADTPHLLDWEQPERWRRYALTDRWARLDFALDVGRRMGSPGYLLLPAHDAVWGKGLLARLVGLSERYGRKGLPAAVSPYTYHQHSPIPGAAIPQDIIDLMNTAFGRDALFGWKLRLDRAQALWGKLGMMPFGMCAAVRGAVEKMVWEDDRETDGAIRRLGYGVRGWYVRDPAVYRQAPPVFDRAGLRTVIERTLHYSLNIPGGGSALNAPLGVWGQARRWLNLRFANHNAEAEAIITDCNAAIRARLERYGASWVDWGAYRYVMRVGDPAVEVWKA